MNRFCDFAIDDHNLRGRKVSMNDIIGMELAFWAFRVFPSSKKENTECMQIQFDLDGEQCVAFTGSTVLIRQMRQYETQLPFTATIIRRNKYLTLS